MVNGTLVEDAIREGAKLLSELDRQLFPVDLMFWAQLEESRRWRLIIGSELVPDEGQHIAYRRLIQILRSQDFGLDSSNISIFAPQYSRLQSLLADVESSGTVVSGSRWLNFNAGVVYRWNGSFLQAKFDCSPTEEEISTKLARVPNEPKLLFEINGTEVIFRVHPRHHQGSIQGHVQRLKLALSRPDNSCKLLTVEPHERLSELAVSLN